VKGRIVNLAAGSQPDSRSATQYRMLSRLFRERLTREIAFSMVSCVHCGACAQACHYALARAHDPCMTPAYKAIRSVACSIVI
jgi:formate hydrogenlyase subunit 6/NADH:ubiquinone oxidoreductase subunit I